MMVKSLSNASNVIDCVSQYIQKLIIDVFLPHIYASES